MVKFVFFQAEDGRRDGHVTGVQTCALPISMSCAVCTAVPEGASTLSGWCSSITSADSNHFAACCAKFMARTAEREKLGAMRTPTLVPASAFSTRANDSWFQPVVLTTA